MTGTDFFHDHLAKLERTSRLRRLERRNGLDFSSNDYLALADNPEITRAVGMALAAGVPLGSGGSRLLRGNRDEHEYLEEGAAAFFNAEAALFFSSGFLANQALYSTVPQPGDLIIVDELVHASVHEGLRRARAPHRFARHNDTSSFEAISRSWRSEGNRGAIFIGVESLYSMDGDLAPLADLDALANELGCWLFVDEAHATGVYGPQGRGLTASLSCRSRLVALHSCAKALGVQGALLLLPERVRQFLINRARPFIFSTAPSPLLCVAALAALHIAAAADDRRAELRSMSTGAAAALRRKLGIEPSPSHILPVILGSDDAALASAARLRSLGFDVRPIRPPTVQEGTSRLRISLNLNVTLENALQLIDVIGMPPT